MGVDLIVVRELKIQEEEGTYLFRPKRSIRSQSGPCAISAVLCKLSPSIFT